MSRRYFNYLDLEHCYLTLGNRRFFNDISLRVGEGQRWVVFGPYGCGKSLIARVVRGMIAVDSGRVHVLDRDVADLGRTELNEMRRHIGFVPRDNHLIHNLTVRENLRLPLSYQMGLSDQAIDHRVGDVVDFLHLDSFLDVRPESLPAIIAKKVAIGQAIARLPEILIVDGLRGRLDPITGQRISRLVYDEIPAWWKDRKGLPKSAPGPVILALATALHGVEQSVDFAAMLYDGRFVFHGSRQELEKTDNPYVRQYFSGAADGPIQYDERT